jgi:phosphoribosylformylglycinamidine synthase PurS subunit
MIFQAEIVIKPREGVLDTQGKAVEKTLSRLGYSGLEEVRIGKVVTMRLEASDRTEAEKALRSMCSDLLCNDLIETFNISVRESTL